MRRFFAITMAGGLVATAYGQGVAPDEPYWTPDASLIATLEAGLKLMTLPKQATYPAAQYDRYYAGVTVNGARRVIGKWILPPNREDSPKTGIHITDVKYLPQLLGGGCGVVTVTYFVDRNEGFGQCNLKDAGAPVSEQPHWKPEEATAQQMESEVLELLQRAQVGFPGLVPYSRYYSGVTIEGRKVIRGRLMRLSPQEAGLHVQSEDNGPRMSDGHCNNIRAAFDVASAQVTQLACDGEPPIRMSQIP